MIHFYLTQKRGQLGPRATHTGWGPTSNLPVREHGAVYLTVTAPKSREALLGVPSSPHLYVPAPCHE
jgi:hypothetical protein